MADDKRVSDGQFVAFGPEQARKAREGANLPEPPVVTDAPKDAGLIRRLWALMTRGTDDHRKLWTSERARVKADSVGSTPRAGEPRAGS